MHTNPGKGQDSGCCSGGSKYVQRTRKVSDEVGKDTAECRTGVEHGEKIEAQFRADDVRVDGIGLDVEEEIVEAHETQEHGNAEHDELGFLEGGYDEELALILGRESQFHCELGDADGSQTEETDCAGCPWESNLLLELVEHNGVHDTSDTASRGRNSVGQTSSLLEVLR